MKKISLLPAWALLFVFTLLLPVQSFAYTSPIVAADSVLGYTNAQRYRQGLPFLSSNSTLSKVAQNKMLDLFANQYFAHESPSGETASDLAKHAGYKFLVVGENLALGNFQTSKEVVNAWMNSPGHRKNILSETYTEIGVAAGKGMYEGRYTWIVVQSFGTPQSSCPAIDNELKQKLALFDQKLNVLKTIADMREREALRTTGTISERKARIESYNTAAHLYNENVEKYRDLVDQYNESVGDYNECLMKIREHLEE